MNLNQLLYFCSVARTGNYSHAAEEWDVSQPVVYRAVKRLEKACGVKMLQKVGRRVRLTAAGRNIYGYGAKIASLANEADQALALEKGSISGSLSIGAGTPIADYFIPQILAKWIAEHPRVTVSLHMVQTHEMQRLLLEDRLDVLIVSGNKWQPGLHRQLLFSDRLVVVAAADNPLTTSKARIADLADERLLLPLPGSSVREEIEQVEYQYGVQFKVAMEAGRQDTIKQLCRAGAGIAVLPESIVLDEIANNQLRIVDAEGFPRSHPYFIVYRVGKSLTPEMQSLISSVRAQAEIRREY